ncbi:MAG: hypothetical protein ACJA2K_002179 [Thalassolituus sp.]|jgi:hypothetical protein
MSKLTLNIVETEINESELILITLVSENKLASEGLTSNLILGFLPYIPIDKSEIYQIFQENREFRSTLTSFINTVLTCQDELINQAKAQRTGWIYLIDQRTSTPQGDTPPEDIIGGFQIENGEILKFTPNTKHTLISNAGVFSLGNSANKLLLQYVENSKFNTDMKS